MIGNRAARLRSLEGRVFIALVFLTSAAFLWMVRGFLMPVFWAAVLAVLFRPLFLRSESALRGRRGAAALLSTLAVILIVLLPTALLLAAVAQQALWLYTSIASGQLSLEAPLDFAQRTLPRLMDLLARYDISIEQLRASLEGAAVAATQYIAARVFIAGQNALMVAVMFALMLYFLFFFFRDGDRIVAGVIRALPMGDVRERRLLQKFAEVSRATVKGTLVVAAVQGALGGLMFALVGIRAAIFWGVAMGVLSLLPAVGAALVWVPAAIILIAVGSIWQGVVVIVGGALVIGVVDNLLRPILVGRAAEMPDYLVLLATLGGLSAFGLAGFVAGPVIAALFLVLWEMFVAEYATVDDPPVAGAAPPGALVAAAAPVGTVRPATAPGPAPAGEPAGAEPSQHDPGR